MCLFIKNGGWFNWFIDRKLVLFHFLLILFHFLLMFFRFSDFSFRSLFSCSPSVLLAICKYLITSLKICQSCSICFLYYCLFLKKLCNHFLVNLTALIFCFMALFSFLFFLKAFFFSFFYCWRSYSSDSPFLKSAKFQILNWFFKFLPCIYILSIWYLSSTLFLQ